MKRNTLWLYCWIMIASTYSSCSGTKTLPDKVVVDESRTISPNKLNGGASGMTQIGPSAYLGIYDIKSHQTGPRVAMIATAVDRPIQVTPIYIEDWNNPEGQGNDLESICRIGNSGNEFLMAESGDWQGKFGRIFHLSVDTVKREGKILGTIKLPQMATNNFDLVGDQYEGMTCIKLSDEEVMLILAERGGSPPFPTGMLRWATLNLKSYSLTFSEAGKEGIAVDAPGHWTQPDKKRDITSLHVDDNGEVWAAASQDISDAGPFYSVIYRLGKLTGNMDKPVEVYSNLSIWREVSGYKIEALSGPCASVPNSKISFATEDESYGGNWRAIE